MYFLILSAKKVEVAASASMAEWLCWSTVFSSLASLQQTQEKSRVSSLLGHVCVSCSGNRGWRVERHDLLVFCGTKGHGTRKLRSFLLLEICHNAARSRAFPEPEDQYRMSSQTWSLSAAQSIPLRGEAVNHPF